MSIRLSRIPIDQSLRRRSEIAEEVLNHSHRSLFEETMGEDMEPRRASTGDGRESRPYGHSLHAVGVRPHAYEIMAQMRKEQKKSRSQRRLIVHSDSSIRPVTPSEKAKETTGLMSGSESIREETDDNSAKPQSLAFLLCDFFFGKWVSFLLVFLPFGYAAHVLQWPPIAVFWLNFLAMIPLAAILGDFTEEVAAHTNQTIGGLVNATFGNAVEVVVAIQALLHNEIRVVQASMIGSIFSNLLLVLGCCFFFGGLYYKEQGFNSTAATANMGLLALSSTALVLPTPFAEYYVIEDEHVLIVSRIAAVFLMSMYLQLLLFQLRTHSELFEDDEDEEEDLPRIPFSVALVSLLFITILVAIFSEFLVASIDGFTEESGISRTFVGLILLPIVGNAVEHLTAVNVAMKDKMDLAMGIAVGSCTQIALFVIPLTVLIGWACGKDMTLNFPMFEIMLYILSVVTVFICLSNPKGNWLEGSLLITTYVMIAVGFWFENVVNY